MWLLFFQLRMHHVIPPSIGKTGFSLFPFFHYVKVLDVSFGLIAANCCFDFLFFPFFFCIWLCLAPVGLVVLWEKVVVKVPFKGGSFPSVEKTTSFSAFCSFSQNFVLPFFFSVVAGISLFFLSNYDVIQKTKKHIPSVPFPSSSMDIADLCPLFLSPKITQHIFFLFFSFPFFDTRTFVLHIHPFISSSRPPLRLFPICCGVCASVTLVSGLTFSNLTLVFASHFFRSSLQDPAVSSPSFFPFFQFYIVVLLLDCLLKIFLILSPPFSNSLS